MHLKVKPLVEFNNVSLMNMFIIIKFIESDDRIMIILLTVKYEVQQKVHKIKKWILNLFARYFHQT